MPVARPPEIRVATVTDADAVAALTNRAYAFEAGRVDHTSFVTVDRTSPERIASMITDPGSAILVAAVDGSVAASCHVTAEADTAHLDMLAVEPAMRSSGVARQLGEATLAHARDALGCSSAEIEVLNMHPELQRCYEHAGFVATGATRPFPAHVARVDGLSFVVLRRDLRSRDVPSPDLQGCVLRSHDLPSHDLQGRGRG